MSKVYIIAEVIEKRTVKGITFCSVKIEGRENPIWVQESEIAEIDKNN